jgi:hypothetical protein
MRVSPFVCLPCALTLASCATTDQFMRREPAAVYHSAKSRDAVAECLMNRLSSLEIAFHREEFGPETRVSMTGSLGPGLVYSIRDEGSGSVTEMRRATAATLWQKTALSCF